MSTQPFMIVDNNSIPVRAVTPATDAVFSTGGATVVNSANFPRPADTTAYASGDLVANSTVAGSVAPMSIAAARVAAGSGIVRRLLMRKSTVSLTNASFRVHLFSVAPTVANGDNGALSMTGVAGYIGKVDITMDQAFTDGAFGASDITMGDLQFKLPSGTVLYALIEARAAYTPGNAEVFTLHAEVLQD